MNSEKQFDESELNAAISEVLQEPIDQAAEERVIARASKIPNERGSAEGRPFYSANVAQPTARGPRWLAGGVAGAVAASLAFVIWLTSLPTSTALADVVEHVMQIKNLQFEFVVQRFDDVAQTGTVMIRDQTMRIENQIAGHSLVSLVDVKRKEVLVLDDERKLAQELDGVELSQLGSVNPIQELVAAKDKSFKSLGNDLIDGERVEVLKVRGLSIMGIGDQAEMTLWVDATTKLPVKIEMLDADPKSKTQIVFEEFQWNAVMAAEQFAIAIPQGYQAGEVVTVPDFESEPPAESQDLNEGQLFAGRVPSRIVVDQERAVVTALLREPEDASVPRSNELRQWDLASGEQRWSANVGGAGEVAVCSAKGLLAVVIGKEIQLRELSTGRIVRTWASNHLSGCVAFNASGTRLADGYTEWARPARSAPPTGGVEVWNVETARLEHDIDGLGRVDAVEFAPLGEGLLVSSANFKCRLYNGETAELEYSFLGRRGTFSPDGKRVAVVSAQTPVDKEKGRVDLFSIDTRQLVRSFVTAKGATNSYLLSLAFSEDGKSLAAGDWNGTISFWDTASGESKSVVRPLPAGVHCVRFAPSHRLLSGCEDMTLRVHDLGP